MGVAIRFNVDDRMLSALSPMHVASYLRGHGWKDEGKYGEYGQLYSIMDGAVEVVLPRLATVADFRRRMSELLSKLAQIEDRDPAFILSDLAMTPFDVIRVRSQDADAYGSIRLDDGLQLHEEAKKLVVAAAFAEASVKPRKAWKGRHPESIRQYVERLRLGQTENASFSLTILSPYSFEPADQLTLFGDEAFGRRVTRKFGVTTRSVLHRPHERRQHCNDRIGALELLFFDNFMLNKLSDPRSKLT